MMRVAFVGKGGSGKSTISAFFVKYCLQQGKPVLAIDLDYNMDLAFNLGMQGDLGGRTIAQSRPDFYRMTGLPENGALKDLIDRFEASKHFDPDDPTDDYSARYALDVSDQLKLMVVGPTPDDRLYGKECGHVFMSPIRYYLPMLQTERWVVLDSTAGTDLVSFGMYQGADVIVCVVEPRPNSLRVFEQMRPIAAEFNIPLRMVINKDGPQAAEMFEPYKDKIIARVPFTNVDDDTVVNETAFGDIYRSLQQLTIDPALRQSRLVQWKRGHDTKAA